MDFSVIIPAYNVQASSVAPTAARRRNVPAARDPGHRRLSDRRDRRRSWGCWPVKFPPSVLSQPK